MVGKLGRLECVRRGRSQLAENQAGRPFLNLQAFGDEDCPELESDVVIRTKAQNVAFHIWPIMRSAKWSNVCALGVCTGCDLDSLTAYLAVVVVEFFHPSAHSRIANKPLNS